MRRSDSLAVFGGKPAFEELLHVGRPNIGDRERLLARIGDALDRRWLTNAGPLVRELEQKTEDLLNVRHCVAMCNGTIALEILVRALGLKGEVIIPSYTFIATAHCLQWQEITPVFCDIDPATHNIDPEQVERLITPRTSGILAVHLWGRPCNVEALEDIARRRGLHLLFDASHAFGCSAQGRMVGGFGEAETLSFHATKFVNAFEGGAVVTNDDDLAKRMRLMKNFGFAGLDNVVYVGTNGKMHEVTAAMGLTSLESLDEFVAVNRENYRAYQQHLAEVPGVSLLDFDEREHCNYQYVVLEVNEEATGLARDQLLAVLHAENIRARRYFWPGCHRMEPYRSYFPNAGLILPETEKVARRVVVLPTGTALNPEDVAVVCGIIGAAIEQAPAIAERMLSESPPDAELRALSEGAARG